MPINHSTTIAVFRNKLNNLAPVTTLQDQELCIERDGVSLRPIGAGTIAGVVTELPKGFRACDLLEAVRIGETNFTRILEALETMGATSSRFDQKFALDAALGHLDDFSMILLGIHHCNKPVPADPAATTDS